jgi:type VI secretion system secreted protein Hcp
MAFGYFLRIDGIAGESADSKHQGEIAVQSFSWAESNTGPVAGGGGGGAGKVSMQDLHVTAHTSKASPQLLLACATGQHFKAARLVARKASKAQADFLTFSLQDVLVTTYQVGASVEGGPLDSVSLNFGRIEVEYKEQQADGSLGASTKAGWDVKANKKL